MILFNERLTAKGKCEISLLCREMDLHFDTIVKDINSKGFKTPHELYHYCIGLIQVQTTLKELSVRNEL